MLNGFLALGWPIYVVDELGGAGLALLAVTWWLFDRYARPWIAGRLPEPPPSTRSRGPKANQAEPEAAADASRAQPETVADVPAPSNAGAVAAPDAAPASNRSLGDAR
jgi:hypothetical protein